MSINVICKNVIDMYMSYSTVCHLYSFAIVLICSRNFFCAADPSRQVVGSLVTTRNSSGDDIVNVNFLYDDIVHVIQNTIDSCINSATARCDGYVLEHMFTKFSEIM